MVFDHSVIIVGFKTAIAGPFIRDERRTDRHIGKDDTVKLILMRCR